ncbi:MAG: hypothetical protein Q7R98_03455 [Candidatus Jorgensenbacteria bacterium]|nr:hypothetical protein [Candidatus Jorgensenbacteria bacterium]
MNRVFKNRDSLRRVFSGVGVAFTTMVLILGFAVLIIGGASLLRSWFEAGLGKQLLTNLRTFETEQKIGTAPSGIRPPLSIQFGTKPSIAPVITKEPLPPGSPFAVQQKAEENLTLSSFTDLFSGVGWIDQSKTTMHQDRSATAFMFPTVISAQKITAFAGRPALSQPNGFVERGSNGEDVRCAGSKCFSQRDFELLFQGSQLSLPADLQGKQLVNISVGNLDALLLLGAVTRRNDGTYEGWAFYFDGKNFSKVFGGEGNPFVSQYPGTLGFGGNDNDWIAMYGAYEGIAYRIRGGETPTDLSYFFHSRLMDDGFQPVVLRTQVGNDSESTAWYIFSLTSGNPKLIKLFQNKTREIQGIADLTSLVGPLRNASNASFNIEATQKGEVVLRAKTGNALNTEFWEIKDDGFDKSKSREVTSANINNYPAEVRSAKISELDFSTSGGKVEFALSSDGVTWVPATLNQDVSFSGENRSRLLWRARFTPDSDTETTPFLDRLRLDYKVSFL